ncbi:hypothetical protein SAMN06265173_1133 [Thalassovita litoralis]|uniref:Uncharacterized protein n=2 Tax=Thalassovita litoralis TaxID=1010611 RepID=A0A521DYQ4_9RHOB|nr:hypothetical protein SAMN06265173_1133 [Thalassovita litoralis]
MFSSPAPNTESEAITIEPIRERAAVLRGVPQDRPHSVKGVSLKWDAKAGGFVFSRKNTDKVSEAVGLLTAFERGRQRSERSSSRLEDIWEGSISSSPLTRIENKPDALENKKRRGNLPIFNGMHP